jgi:Tol biopolymer transport system component
MKALRQAGVLVGACATLSIASATALPAGATFPGKNGLIAFQSFRNGFAQIYVMTDAPNQPQRVRAQRACYALPAWSPDGRRIAFEFNPDPDGRNSFLSDIYAMNADGTGVVRLTNAYGFDGDPSWSPDGRRIVFESTRSGNPEVWVMNADGSGQSPLTRNPAFDGDPAWSPGGQRIAFTSTRDGDREIYLMSPNGTGLKNITQDRANDFDPSWSPTGELVAFVSDRDGNLELYATNDRSRLKRLTNNPALDAFPAWSPDSSQIVFVSDREEPGNRDLYVMSAGGGPSARKLTESTAWDQAPDWQPLSTARNPAPRPRLLAPRRAKPGPPGPAVACVGR